MSGMFRLAKIAICGMGLLSACGLAPKQSGGDILIVGDSVMAWNQDMIGQSVASELHRDVVSRAASGARIDASASVSVLGLSIPGQLSAGPWNWIVMDGGANDLADSCGCGRCDNDVNALISPDGSTGSIPKLISDARATGAQVLWMGYYQAPQSASFAACRSSLVEMERRIAAYAQSHAGVHFVDAEAVFAPTDRSLYSADMTHPSPEGSALLGAFLARSIMEEDRR